MELRGILQRGALQRASGLSVFNPPLLHNHLQTPTQTQTAACFLLLHTFPDIRLVLKHNSPSQPVQYLSRVYSTRWPLFINVSHLFILVSLHRNKITQQRVGVKEGFFMSRIQPPSSSCFVSSTDNCGFMANSFFFPYKCVACF